MNVRYQCFEFLQKYVEDPFQFLIPTIVQKELYLNNAKLSQSEMAMIENGNAKQEFRIAIVNNYLFAFEKSQKLLKVLNIEFCYCEIKRSNPDNKKTAIILSRNNSTFTITFNQNAKQGNIKELCKLLQRYCLRIESLKRYQVLNKLGEGGQAKVYKVIKGNGLRVKENIKQGKEDQRKTKQYAVKIIDIKTIKATYHLQQIYQKIQIMRRLYNCSGTVKLIKIFVNKSFLNIFLEYQPGGTLFELIQRNRKYGSVLNINDKKIITAQILLTVDYLQQNGILHRDLKPQNILLGSKEKEKQDIKVADFGYSMDLASHNPELGKEICGTPGFIAPEILRKCQYSPNSDLFSVGCLIYLLVTNEFLISGRSNKDVLKQNRICDQDYINSKLNVLPGNLQLLLKYLLNTNPDRRPDAFQALQFEWFRSIIEPIKACLLTNNDKRNYGDCKDSESLFSMRLQKKNRCSTPKNDYLTKISNKDLIFEESSQTFTYHQIIINYQKLHQQCNQSQISQEKSKNGNNCFSTIIEEGKTQNTHNSPSKEEVTDNPLMQKGDQQQISFMDQDVFLKPGKLSKKELAFMNHCNHSIGHDNDAQKYIVNQDIDQQEISDIMEMDDENVAHKETPYLFCDVPTLLSKKYINSIQDQN